jgi:hypothetical protein
MKTLQGDPGGYPCHDNAVTILTHYQARQCRPHANACTSGKEQLYWMWRAQWMEECLRQMRPWGNNGAPLKVDQPHEPPVTFSGF